MLGAIMISVSTLSFDPRNTVGQSDACAASAPLQISDKALPDKDLRTAISEAAKLVMPSVVHVEVSQQQVVTNPMLPFEDDPFFRFFFQDPGTPRKFKRELKGLGTGMIIDESGHILTNNHVVTGASSINVVLADGNAYPAKVVGTDPKTDLAVIRISAKNLPPAVTFGDSDKMQVGEWVVAIGHPRGLYQTVTQGIISAKHRQGITEPSNYQDFLQTDAAINPGNSGGPLLNLNGEVIGVNAAIASQSGGFEGIGFAIPGNMAVHVANALIEKGKVERGWIGVTVQDVTPDKAKTLGLTQHQGSLIIDMVKDGPAQKAGLRKDDVILAVDGVTVADSGMLRNLAANTTVGNTLRLTIWRNKSKQEIRVVIGNLEDAAKLMSASIWERLGVELRPFKPAEAGKFGLSEGQGIVIARLDPKGPMAEVGFEVDDAIVQVNNQVIDSVDTLDTVMESVKPSQKISIVAIDHRSGQMARVPVKVR
jgi:serine protease Do